MKTTDQDFTKAMIGQIAISIIFAAMTFTAAGRIDYWQGWAYIAISSFLNIVLLIVFKKEPDLLKERTKPGPGTKRWDKVLMAIFMPLMPALIVVASLDAGRFRWSAALPAYIYVISYILNISSISFVLWAMIVNRFFSSFIRIQSDRGQIVVDKGPYSFIRHPGYAGAIVFTATTPLVLGSLWALIPAFLIIIFLVIRTLLEDMFLKKELAGYDEYAKRVRYRLLPGVW